MTGKERKIIHQCAIALSNLPGKNNMMSGHGAAQYHDEMRDAVGLNGKSIMHLLDGNFEQAQGFANDLTALVFGILLREGLTIVPAMEALRSEK